MGQLVGSAGKAAKPDYLNLIPWTHMGKEGTDSSKQSSDSYMCVLIVHRIKV